MDNGASSYRRFRDNGDENGLVEIIRDYKDGLIFYINSFVGNIHIGDDVFIAPNSFVTTDIPSHSLVIGNPIKIIQRDNATEGYLENTI